jgi:hypothetical protein
MSVWFRIAIAVIAAGAYSGAWSQVAVLGCNAQSHSGYVSVEARNGPQTGSGIAGTVEQSFDTQELVVWTKQDKLGNALRKGSKVAVGKCGSLVFKFEADWFNSNPQGEMGADDFSTVEIFENRKRVFGPVALGACGGMPSRSRLACGDSVTFSWARQSKFVFKAAEGEARHAP